MAGLHDLRVFLKKIKFCQLFLSWVYGKSELGKLPDLTRQVFKQAGLIREMQLVRDWLSKENIKIDKELQCDEPSIQQQLLHLQILLSDNQLQVSKLIKKAELLANKINPI
jgi:CHAD domain-containing protein